MRQAAAKWLSSMFVVAALASPARAADDYPSRTIHIVVGATPGGITDVIARFLGDYITRATGASTTVDNIGGAGGNIGFNQVAKAAPDGYTVGLAAAGNIVVNPFLYKTMQFDPLKDLAAVSPIAAAPQIIMVSAASPMKTLGDLVEFARKNPGAVNYGSAGVGTTQHLSGAMLERLAHIEMTHVPYRGSSAAVTDLVAGRLQMVAIGAQPVISFIKDGQLRALAVTDAHRLPNLPDVPTTAEAGFPGYEVSSWFGLFAPKNTPEPVIARLEGVVRAMLNDPAERKKLTDVSFIPMDMPRREFQALLDKEATSWSAFIRETGITTE